jgi:hypothetical protein
MTRDRLSALLDPPSGRNGIDYVELVGPSDPPVLRVHFLTSVALSADPVGAQIDGGDRIPVIPVADIVAADWSTDADGRPLLNLHPMLAGDFSTYTLTLTGSTRLDPRFATAPVSFKAFCPSKFDCAPEPEDCPPSTVEVPPIDYLAKDFASFRRVLLEDSSRRYPGWVERSEADVGVMLAEALSALADELSYQQDSAAADLNFATAISRQALTAQARLVDYEPAPARSARCELMLIVAGSSVAAGTRVDGLNGDGQRIGFEIGEGLAGPATYAVDSRANWPLAPWWWDDGDQCLHRRATELWLVGDALGLIIGDRILIQTDLPGETIRQIVTITEVAADFDPLFPLGTGTKLTRVTWGVEDALRRDHDLGQTLVGGNIVPATQGVRHSERFAVPPAPITAANATVAIEREGTDGRTVQRLPLRAAPLAWLPDATAPEIQVVQTDPEPANWHYTRMLLDADALAAAYVVDQESWRAVSFAGDGTPTHWEPDGEDGATVRFGDGLFGAPPEPGAVMTVTYRTGMGAQGNLPADSIRDVIDSLAIVSARNPLPSEGGADAETALQVRRFAPQAFRQRPLRVVRAEDYVAAARELPWVQDAGARFRWTGSWHSVFTAADPNGGFDLGLQQHLELQQLLDRRRLAGVEAFTPRPRFVSIDLQITLCVAAIARRDDVERRVIQRLAPPGRSGEGFFFADHFTFGSPLYRARLEAAVADVPGVKGVLDIRYRRRAALSIYLPLPPVVTLGTGEILRIDNEPDWPERGTITIVTEGGA